MSRICENCSKELAESEKVCAACGTEFNENAETPVACSDAANEEAVKAEACKPENANADSVKKSKTVQNPASPVQKTKVKEKPVRRITVGGVIGAVILSIFLILNIVLSYAAAIGVGFAASDIRDISINFGDKEYSVDALLDIADDLEKSDTEKMLADLIESDEVLELEVAGTTYEVDVLSELLEDYEKGVPSMDDLAGRIIEAANKVLSIVCIVLIALLVYFALVLYVNTYSIYSALGKTKRAHISSGVIFALFGIAEAVASVIVVFMPELFGVAFLHTFEGLIPVAITTLAISVATTAVGIILFLSGILAKKK